VPKACVSPKSSYGSCVKYISSTPNTENSVVISVFSVSNDFNLKRVGSIFSINLPSKTLASLRSSGTLVVYVV
jgi:hypothetical protein